MARDEFGMPLPSKSSPLPWQDSYCREVADANFGLVAEKFWTESDTGFAVHAANNIIPAREIVRRLAEWSKSDSMDDFIPVIRDAEKLWEKMQSEASDGIDSPAS